MATIKDISQKLGISHATVSYVLNGRAEQFKIRQDVCRKVLETAKELGYVRNSLARSMVTGRSNTIGFVINSGMGTEFVQRITGGILQAVDQYDFSLKLFDAETLNKATVIRRLREQQITGVILHHPDIHVLIPWLKELKGLDVPCGIVNMRNDTGIGHGVISDDIRGTKDAVHYLVSLGHTKIAHLTADVLWDYVRERETGYRQGMEEIPACRPHIIRIGLYGFGSNLKLLKRFLSGKKDRPTAVVCDSDYHALELFQAAYQLNIKVPDELSILGFGGLSPAKYSAVPLTTVEQPFEQIGFEAARMLLEHITTQKVIDGRNIILQNSLALADSCAMPSAMQHHKKNNRKGKEFS